MAADVRWHGVNPIEVFDAAEYHRVSAFLLAGDDAAPLPSDVLELAKLAAIRRKFSQARMAADLRRVQAAAGNALRLPWVVLKGPALVGAVYRGAAREYVDLDIMVDGRELGTMVDALVGEGATLRDRNFEFLSKIRSGELSVQMPGGTTVDLHWHPIHSHRVRRHFKLNATELMARAVPVSIGGSDSATIMGLEPTDHLIYLCVHACLSGAERLLWFKDIDLAFRNLDWDRAEFIERCNRWGLSIVAGLMLARAERVLGTPVDRRLLKSLRASWLLSAVAALLDRLSPPHRQTEIGLDRTFFRSVRNSTSATLWELAAQMLGATLPARWDFTRPWRDNRGDETSVLESASMVTGRANYFSAVRLLADAEAKASVDIGEHP